jgi:hypothetical protein
MKAFYLSPLSKIFARWNPAATLQKSTVDLTPKLFVFFQYIAMSLLDDISKYLPWSDLISYNY